VARADGRRLTFEEEGIYNGVFVMRDHETGTLWSHYTGEAFEGPLKGRTLEWIQTDRSRAGRLLAESPDTTVPARKSMKFRPSAPAASKRDAAMGDFLPPAFGETIDKRDKRLAVHEHGIGIFAGGAHHFVPLDALSKRSVLQDRVGDLPVVISIFDKGEAAAAWSRCVDGEPLTFAAATWEDRVALVDQQTRSTWVAGEAVDGPMKGRTLTVVRSIITDWYGWVAYFPDSTTREDERSDP